MATYQIKDNTTDETANYQTDRYVSTAEAFWRIYSYPLHECHPTVVELQVHLENGQHIYFTDDTPQAVLEQPPQTTLTAFFKLCQADPFARTLLYHQVPAYYTWANSKWCRRKQGQESPNFPGIKKCDALGRVYTVHSNNQECFYLRMLLHEVRGPTSYQDLKMVNDLCPTFRSACQQRGLLKSDRQWHETIQDAILTTSPAQIRRLFAMVLSICHPADPGDLWDSYKDSMADDYLHQYHCQMKNMTLPYHDQIYNKGLVDIENHTYNMACQKLDTYGLPSPDRSVQQQLQTEIIRETTYNKEQLEKFVKDNEEKLLPEQHMAYHNILCRVHDRLGGFVFLDAPGGTGKTFLLNLILAKVH